MGLSDSAGFAPNKPPFAGCYDPAGIVPKTLGLGSDAVDPSLLPNNPPGGLVSAGLDPPNRPVVDLFSSGFLLNIPPPKAGVGDSVDAFGGSAGFGIPNIDLESSVF